MSIKLTAFIAAILLTVTVSAQFKKGTRMPGMTVGSILFNSGSADITYPAPTLGITSKTTSFSAAVSPSMGWFISEHTVLGVALNINPSTIKTTYEGSNGNTFQQDKATAFNIGIGGFARNYFSSASSFIPFGQFGLNAGISNRNTDGFFIASSNAYKDSYDGKSSGGFFVNAALSLGATKLLTPHTGLDFYAGYNFSYNKNTYKTTTLRDIDNNGSIETTSVNEPTTKFTNHGFMIGIGFQVFLDPRK